MSEVSVVIPAHNAAMHIREAVESALAQSLPPLEIIIVDDGSTDDTRAVLDPFVVSGKVRYFAQENQGPAAARNAGIRQSRGALVAFLDADDLWCADKLMRQLPRFENPAIALVYADMSFFGDAHGPKASFFSVAAPFRGHIFMPLVRTNFIPTSSVVVRKDAALAIGGFDESRELIAVEDYDLWLRIAVRHDADFVPDVLARYRVHAGQISQSGNPYRGLIAVYRKLLHDPSASFARPRIFARLAASVIRSCIIRIFA